MHDRETRLVEANLAALARGSVLSIGFGRPVIDLLRAHPDVRAVTAFNHDLITHASVDDGMFGPWLGEGGPFDVALIRLPKERDRTTMVLAMARALIRSGGTIALAGANDGGIRGAATTMRETVGEPITLDTRAHCRLLVTDDIEPQPASLEDWVTTWEAGGIPITGFPGVFSVGELDPGTELLLRALPKVRGKRVLDIGCGAGILAAYLARDRAIVTATDVDALAIESTTRTLEANDLEATVLASDVTKAVEGPFDVVVSNPPFHLGVRTTTSIARRIITDAPLRKGGALIIVGNSHLDHGAVMRDHYGAVETLASTARYTVWQSTR